MASQDPGVREKVLSFGPFLLFRSEKVLRGHGRAVRLGGRAIDVLIALVERAGEVVSKNELMNYAWPDTIVEENNLRVHVAAIRKILGDGHGDIRYIINVAGRGYSFIAPVTRVDSPQPSGESMRKTAHVLPSPLTHVVGRDEVINHLVAQISRRRLLTIVGSGGVGKTTVGIAVAEQLAVAYERVCFVDLSTVEDPGLVPSALATVIGISALTDDPLASLTSFLRDRQFLIVLDNCEHVIAQVATLVERILRGAPKVDVIATSREPLLAEGEYVCNLAPLASPPESAALPTKAALQFPAVQLFVERATGGLESFELTDDNVAQVVQICQRLDGIPLAIELVAARVNLLGLGALGKGFGDDIILTAQGRRTARPRHQSLRATLDWSYLILTPIEQVIFRRLAVFRRLFSAESAGAVVSAGTLAGGLRIVDLLMSLVGKSLLTTDISGPAIRYRLLHITRAYASERLMESGERTELLRRHAEHVRVLLDAAIEDWDKMARDEWLNQYGNMIDDARAAMDWAFSAGGNLELGAALTVASLPFGFQLSLINETMQRAALALEAVTRLSPPNPLWEMRINNTLAGLLASTGASDDAVLKTIDRALAQAQQTGVARYLIEPLANRGAVQSHMGDFVAALKTAQTLESVARESEDPTAILIADRYGAQISHLVGDHVRSRSLIERVLRNPARTIPLSYGQTPVDRRVSMRIMLARILWLEGTADQAMQLADETIELSISDGPLAICQALGLAACPIAFWRGDLIRAQKLTQDLLDYSRRYNFDRWTALGACYRRSVELMANRQAGDPQVTSREVFEIIPESVPFPEILPTINDNWLGGLDDVRLERGRQSWAAAEFFRASADRAFHQRIAAESAIEEAKYRESLMIARAQKALAWELRTATSLASLWRSQGRTADALAALQPVYERFTEGHDTADLTAARTLIEALTSSS